jgi:UDP-glucose 4-epimerase
MKLAITGALGHIGSEFIHSLKPHTYEEVLLLDNLSTQRYCSLFHLPAGISFRFVEQDICTADLKNLFRGLDAVVHLAAITNAAESFEIQEQVEGVNVEGTRRVAEACAINGCRLFFPSMTSVYGTQQHIVAEDCPESELKPQSPYAASKLNAERLLASMGQSQGLRFIACRFGTIYGASIGMRFHTAINKFVWQACLGLPITVWRTAWHQKRPYLHLDDAIRAIHFILRSDRFDTEIYNVLTDNAAVSEIVETIGAFVPDLQVEFVDSRIMNQLSYHVRSDKFMRLGFQFTGSLSRGIRDTVALFNGFRQRALHLGGPESPNPSSPLRCVPRPVGDRDSHRTAASPWRHDTSS